jgi:hypothetical protein
VIVTLIFAGSVCELAAGRTTCSRRLEADLLEDLLQVGGEGRLADRVKTLVLRLAAQRASRPRPRSAEVLGPLLARRRRRRSRTCASVPLTPASAALTTFSMEFDTPVLSQDVGLPSVSRTTEREPASFDTFCAETAAVSALARRSQ